MRTLSSLLAVFALTAGSARAAQQPPGVPALAKDNPAAALERLIHDAVAARLAKVQEDTSGWGHTIPLPEQLRRPRTRRVIVDVDGHPEVPDGTWHKVRLWLADADRDLEVRVKSFRRLDGNKFRLEVLTDVALRTEADVRRWRNGILLADLTARARVALRVSVACEVRGRLDTDKFPPELRLDADLRELTVDVGEVVPTRLTLNRLGVTVGGEMLAAAGEELRSALQALLRQKEPELKKRAGELLAHTLQEGQGPVAAARMLKAAKPLLDTQERPDGQ